MPNQARRTLVYLNPTGVLGGAEMCLLDLLAVLSHDRPDWSLEVVTGEDGPLCRAVHDLGVDCTVLPIPDRLLALGDAGLDQQGMIRQRWSSRLAMASPAALGYLARLRRHLARRSPDLVQCNGMKAHILGASTTRPGVPVVWHLHDYVGSRPIMARLLRWSSRSRRRLSAVAVSRSVAADAVRVLGSRVPVRWIHNAVDLARFSPGPGSNSRLDAEAGLPEAPAGTVRIGLVATYAHWKGHETFLNALTKIPESLPARFYIVGGPIYRSVGSQLDPLTLRARAEALGLKDRVGWIGHQDDPAAIFRDLDVVVHASTRPEPFGRVIAEGMACGRAVVAVPMGGAAEVFVDGVSALGCSAADPDRLAEVLVRLIRDPELRCRLGRAGREHAVRAFDRDCLAGQWTALYDEAWKRPASRIEAVAEGSGRRA